jgi:hypothetical protein
MPTENIKGLWIIWQKSNYTELVMFFSLDGFQKLKKKFQALFNYYDNFLTY